MPAAASSEHAAASSNLHGNSSHSSTSLVGQQPRRGKTGAGGGSGATGPCTAAVGESEGPGGPVDAIIACKGAMG